MGNSFFWVPASFIVVRFGLGAMKSRGSQSSFHWICDFTCWKCKQDCRTSCPNELVINIRVSPYVYFLWLGRLNGPKPLPCRGFEITLSYTHTLCRTPLDEWSSRRRDFCLPDNTRHSQETSMSPTGFEPAVIAVEWLQAHARSRCHGDRHMFI